MKKFTKTQTFMLLGHEQDYRSEEWQNKMCPRKLNVQYMVTPQSKSKQRLMKPINKQASRCRRRKRSI